MCRTQVFSKPEKPQAPTAATVKGLCSLHIQTAPYTLRKVKYLSPEVWQPAWTKSDRHSTKTTREAGEGNRGSPEEKGTSPRFPRAREMEARAVLRRVEVTSQKTGCHWSCFSQSLPMSTERGLNSSLDWHSCHLVSQDEAKEKSNKPQSWHWRKDRQTESSRRRTWTGMAWQPPWPEHPSSPVHLLRWRLLIPTAGAGVEGCRRKRVNTGNQRVPEPHYIILIM